MNLFCNPSVYTWRLTIDLAISQCAAETSDNILLTIYDSNIKSWSHIIQHMTHDAVEISLSLDTLHCPSISFIQEKKHISTYILPSKQILGPTILAAPLLICTAKWSSGQILERPHFGTGADVATTTEQSDLKSIHDLARGWKKSQ